jgi:hypothetical protein
MKKIKTPQRRDAESQRQGENQKSLGIFAFLCLCFTSATLRLCVERFAFILYLMMFNSRPACAKAAKTVCNCSLVCAADNCTRTRAWPIGTTG